MKSIYQIYNLVIESLILEAMSFDELYENYYKNDVDSLETFKKIVEVDPTSTASKKGKYVDWLIRQAYKADKEHFFEDSYKTKEDLKTFDKNFNKIKKQISQIKDSHELYDIVKDFQEKVDKGEIDLSRSEIKAGAEKIYDDGQWLIVHPKTKEAAMYYGKNTRWCTASEKNNKFDNYNSQGPLYILINRKDPKEKYQFHFETEQYMNEEDKNIPIETYNKFSKGVLDKLIVILYNTKFKEAIKYTKLFRFISNLPENIAQHYITKYNKEHDEYSNLMSLDDAIKDGNTKAIQKFIDNKTITLSSLHNALFNLYTDKQLEIIKLLLKYFSLNDIIENLNYKKLSISLGTTILDHILSLSDKSQKEFIIKNIIFNSLSIFGRKNALKLINDKYSNIVQQQLNIMTIEEALHTHNYDRIKQLISDNSIDINKKYKYLNKDEDVGEFIEKSLIEYVIDEVCAIFPRNINKAYDLLIYLIDKGANILVDFNNTNIAGKLSYAYIFTDTLQYKLGDKVLELLGHILDKAPELANKIYNDENLFSKCLRNINYKERFPRINKVLTTIFKHVKYIPNSSIDKKIVDRSITLGDLEVIKLFKQSGVDYSNIDWKNYKNISKEIIDYLTK